MTCDSGQSSGCGSFTEKIEARYWKFVQHTTICVFKSGVNICVWECVCRCVCICWGRGMNSSGKCLITGFWGFWQCFSVFANFCGLKINHTRADFKLLTRRQCIQSWEDIHSPSPFYNISTIQVQYMQITSRAEILVKCSKAIRNWWVLSVYYLFSPLYYILSICNLNFIDGYV